jgi:hypothetical protein
VRLFCVFLRHDSVPPAAAHEHYLALKGRIAKLKIEEHAIVRHVAGCLAGLGVCGVEQLKLRHDSPAEKKLTAKQNPRPKGKWRWGMDWRSSPPARWGSAFIALTRIEEATTTHVKE